MKAAVALACFFAAAAMPALGADLSDGSPPAAAVAASEPNPADPDGERREPGPEKTYPAPVEQTNPGALEAPPSEAFPMDEVPVPDRWRITKGINELGVDHPWYDPYDQNTWKADRPLPGTNDWFVNLS